MKAKRKITPERRKVAGEIWAALNRKRTEEPYKWSVAEVAKRAGMCSEVLYRVLAGRRHVHGREVAEALAAELGLPVEVVMGDDKERSDA